MTFFKLKLEFFYPALSERLLWYYKNEDLQSINKAIAIFNCGKLFQNKNIYDEPKLFNETIVNIVYNYTPNSCINFNNKDLPWLNGHIKHLTN